MQLITHSAKIDIEAPGATGPPEDFLDLYEVHEPMSMDAVALLMVSNRQFQSTYISRSGLCKLLLIEHTLISKRPGLLDLL